MEKKFTLTITWWPAKNRSAEVPSKYKDALSESGFDRAISMASEGYTSGELDDCVRLECDGEPEDGAEFRGSWSLTESESDPD